jgi:hypothetical protein
MGDASWANTTFVDTSRSTQARTFVQARRRLTGLKVTSGPE